MKYLSKEICEDKDQKEVMVGEYAQSKNKLYMKAFRNREVFSYQF